MKRISNPREGNKMTQENLNEIQKEIDEIPKKISNGAIFIFETIFREDFIPSSVENASKAIEIFLGRDGYSSFTGGISRRRYRDFIEELMGLGKLNGFFDHYLHDDAEADLIRYRGLDPLLKEEVKACQVEILGLTKQLTNKKTELKSRKTALDQLRPARPYHHPTEGVTMIDPPPPINPDEPISKTQKIIGWALTILGAVVAGAGIVGAAGQARPSGNNNNSDQK